MICQNCSGNNDVAEFHIREERFELCADCRFKMLGAISKGKPGRPSLGITQKVSVTLHQEDWDWIDNQGKRSEVFRYLVSRAASPESEWSNNACLGYAIFGARKLGYNEEQIRELIRAIYSEFDFKSVEEAKKVYCDSPY